MKKLSVLLYFILSVCIGYGQNQDSINAIGNQIQSKYANNPDSVKAWADAAAKSFKWDIQNVSKGTLMFLDVPYKREGQDSAEYLTLTVAKNKLNKRAAFISVIIPNNVVQVNGISITFSKTARDGSGNWQIKMEQAEPVKLQFEGCNQEQQTCTARIIGGFVTDERTGEKIDIFQKFMDFDHVYFNFIYPDGSKKSVGVPLFTFKEQYQTLQ